MDIITTRTISKLHFEDLDSMRFEDLCANIVYRLAHWKTFNHIGRAGDDDGIDILAEEENVKKNKVWYIQCKRHSKFSKSNVESVVNKILENNNPPDVLLLIVGCTVSKNTLDFFTERTKFEGIEDAKIIDASTLEAILYRSHHDLLFAYFGIDLNQKNIRNEDELKNKLHLKEKMIKDFTKGINTQKKWTVLDKFISDTIIIHSIEDVDYPYGDSFKYGISSWFKVQPYNFYYNGLEVILGIERVRLTENGNAKYLKLSEYNKYEDDIVSVFRIGRVPYSMIVDYDINGDEYFDCPHIYCRYMNNSSPYEKIIYRLITDNEHDYSEIEVLNT